MTSGGGTHNEDVVILYSDKSIPSKPETAEKVKFSRGGIHEALDIHEATENCDTMNVITMSSQTNQCLAVVGNYDGYHMQKWMRVTASDGELNKEMPLRAVSRGHTKNGIETFVPPNENNIRKHWGMLKTYLNNIDDVLAELRPIAKKVAIDNTIIVLTCNMGQSELLMNFVCNAVAKGFETRNILVFPTDRETQELAEGLGLTTYYDKRVS